MAKKRQFDEDNVLNLVSNFFWNHGYSAAKMDQIAELTGLTKSSLYNAFGNKEALFIKSLEFYIQQQLAPFNNPIDKSHSLSDGIKQIFNFKFSKTNNPLLTQGCLLTNSVLELKSNDIKLHEYVIDKYEEVYTVMCNFFECFITSNKVINGVSKEELTDLYITFQQGLNVQSRNQRANETMHRAMNMFLRLIGTLEAK